MAKTNKITAAKISCSPEQNISSNETQDSGFCEACGNCMPRKPQVTPAACVRKNILKNSQAVIHAA